MLQCLRYADANNVRFTILPPDHCMCDLLYENYSYIPVKVINICCICYFTTLFFAVNALDVFLFNGKQKLLTHKVFQVPFVSMLSLNSFCLNYSEVAVAVFH